MVASIANFSKASAAHRGQALVSPFRLLLQNTASRSGLKTRPPSDSDRLRQSSRRRGPANRAEGSILAPQVREADSSQGIFERTHHRG